MGECDTLLLLGTDFPTACFTPKTLGFLQIDIWPKALGNRRPLELDVVGDAKETVRTLLPLVTEKTGIGFLDAGAENPNFTTWQEASA